MERRRVAVRGRGRRPVHGELLAERFRIAERLGSGATGEVWAAQDERMGRDVAVKLVHALFEAREAETQARFRREVQLAGRLSHPNIVTVHDWGEVPVGGRRVFYLVMELVRGVPLARTLKDGAPPWPVAVGWAAQIARALDAAHRQGVVHRDIKPANVLLTPEGSAKVLDFGIAKFVGETLTLQDLTATGALLGSPAYMSPEQAEGVRRIDHRCDLYSLGCLLYHAVTGRPPFTSDNTLALLRMQMDNAPVPPGELIDGLPASLNDLILGLLAKDPGDRPADASTVHDALSSVLVEQSVTQGTDDILQTARLLHDDPVAGRLLSRAIEVWQRARATAEEVERAESETRRMRLQTELEAQRLLDQANADARALREQAEVEARRVREEALEDARRIWEDVRRQAASQAPPPVAPAVNSAPVPTSSGAGAAVDTVEVPRFTVVDDGYDCEQVDAALASIVRGLDSVRSISRMEQSVTSGIVTRLTIEGHPPDEARRTAESILASALRQAEQEHAARGDGQAAPNTSAPPIVLGPAQRGYDRAEVDQYIRGISAELQRIEVRSAAIQHVLASEATHTQRLKNA